MSKCINKCKREGDICIGCLRTMDEIRRAGMKESFEEKVYRIGTLKLGKKKGDSLAKSITDPVFLQICDFVKAVIEDVEKDKQEGTKNEE